MSVTYIPSNSIPYKTTERFKDYTVTWWQKTDLFYHPAVLCTAAYGREDAWDYREKYKISKDVLFVGDSGGFQQATQGIRVEPIDILKWQENNCDIGFTLDIPPVDPISLKFTEDMNFFKTCANASYRNGEIALRNRNTDMKLYYVVQGRTKEQLDMWTNGCLSNFDGTALSFKTDADGPLFVALQAMYVREKGIKNIHVLRGSGKHIATLIFLLKKYFNKITFDSSSYAIGMQYRKYVLPYTGLHVHVKFGKTCDRKLKILPCNCPICSVVTVDDFNSDENIGGILISLHNLYLYIHYFIFLNGISDSNEIMEHYIHAHCSPAIMRAYNFIKLCDEKGFDDAYQAFFGKKNKMELWFNQ